MTLTELLYSPRYTFDKEILKIERYDLKQVYILGVNELFNIIERKDMFYKYDNSYKNFFIYRPKIKTLNKRLRYIEELIKNYKYNYS